MESLEEHLLNVHVILIATAAWFILWVMRRVWKGIDTNHWVSRYKPLYPALLCQGFVWIPGALPVEQDPTIGYRILIALWCGFLASIGYQIVKRVLLPRGIELPDKPEELLPSPDPRESSSENVVTGEWEDPAISSGEENLRDTPVETPSVQLRKEQDAQKEQAAKKRPAYTPPKIDDLYKPPRM